MNFFKGLLLYIAGIVTAVLVVVILIGISSTETDSLTPQERRYNSCLESVYQGTGDNKITLDSDKASAKDRLSMKKFCLCISNIERSEALLQKKLNNYSKKNNGAEPSTVEYDVLQAEVESEMNIICNKESQ